MGSATGQFRSRATAGGLPRCCSKRRKGSSRRPTQRRTTDSWVWDFWIIPDQETYRAFFLYASRDWATRNCATAGHARVHRPDPWERVADDIVNGSPPSFDKTATWTGSVVQCDDHR